MKLELNKRLRHGLILLGLTLTLCLVIYFPYIFFRVPLQYGTDIKPQWYLFYEEFRSLIQNCIDNHSLPFYSWHLFLGNNFFASKSYYLMGDLFSYLGLLFPTQFFDTALILTILKILIASSSFYYLLTQFEYQFKAKLIGALAFAFSSWALFFSGQLSFLSFYCWMPLYFAGIERYLRYDKKILYLFLCTLLLLTNFYFFFTLSLFTVIYYIWRYALIKPNFKYFIKDTVVLIGVYLIGVALTGFLTLPTIAYMLGNDRVGGMNFTAYYDQFRIYLHELSAAFVPNYLYIYKDNVFETNWHVTRELCLWSGALSALLVPQVFKDPDRHFAKVTGRLLLLLTVMLMLPVTNSLMHGLSDPSFRWTMLLILINLILSVRYLNQPDLIDKAWLKKTALIILGICLLVIPVTAWVSGDIQKLISEYRRQWLLFAACGLLLLFYARLLSSDSNRKITLLLICTAVELGTAGVCLISMNRDTSEKGSFQFIDQVTHVLQDEPDELNQFLLNIEPENYTQYYRVYVPHESLYWSFSHNMSLAYQLNGLMTYDSTYAPSFNDLKKIAPQVQDFDSSWIFNIKDPDLLHFLNVKYAIVTEEAELPPQVNWRLLTDSYRNTLQVYRNDDYRPLGTTYTQVIDYKTFDDEYANDLSLFSDYIVAQDQDLSSIQETLQSQTTAVLENIHYQNNSLTGYITSDDQSFMVLTIPYDPGWKILINGQPVKTYRVNGGFFGVPIEAGSNQFEMYFIPQGFKAGVALSLLGLMVTIIFLLWEYKKRKKYSGTDLDKTPG